MSAETYQDLHDAIVAHVMDEVDIEADIVRDWALVASTQSIDDDGSIAEITLHKSPGTALYTITGLLEWAKQIYDEVGL